MTVTGGQKQNIIKIAQKIHSNQIEPCNPYRVDDILRAKITVEYPEHILDVINTIDEARQF